MARLIVWPSFSLARMPFMKIRSPWKVRSPRMIRVAAWLVAWLVRRLAGTLNYQYQPLGPNMDPRDPALSGRYVYTCWHENLLLPAYHYGGPNLNILISQHADGELIAQVVQSLGFRVVRGSSTRGGMRAVRHCLRVAENGHLGVTPDGPRGPRREVQDGLIYMASRTGLPIIPVGIGYCRPWRAKSWDRFAVPRPWSRARCVTGAPIPIPAEIDREQLDVYRQQVQAALQHAGAVAEQWAETGQWPDDVQQQAA
jgi:lysophospholipid acyltransferase (LPLAT)-like uncharacterized protein